MENNIILFIVAVAFIAFFLGHYIGLRQNIKSKVLDSLGEVKTMNSGFFSFQLGLATERLYPNETQIHEDAVDIVKRNPPPSSFMKGNKNDK